MMLSQRMREIVEAGRTGKSRKDLVKMSFKTQNEPDLIPLVSESLTGLALTLVCVCLSAAPANTSQSINALGFGCEFSRLSVRPSVAPSKALQAVVTEAEKLVASGNGGSGDLANKYGLMRAAQGKTGAQMLALLERMRQ